MKTLFLLRHAKSSWATPGQADHERPLNDRGCKAAAAMGRHIKGLRRSQPTLILASTAQRVTETLVLLLEEWGEGVPVKRHRELYLASPKSLLAHLHNAPENSDNILIVGHNPGIHEFAVQLSGEVAEGAYEARRRLKEAYPTAALTVISFPEAMTWNDIKWGSGILESFTSPSDLKH